MYLAFGDDEEDNKIDFGSIQSHRKSIIPTRSGHVVQESWIMQSISSLSKFFYVGRAFEKLPRAFEINQCLVQREQKMFTEKWKLDEL